MTPKKWRRVSTDLDVIPFTSATPPGDLDWLICAGCGLGLRMCQPDPLAPARLLGTCDGCGRWYLIMMEPTMVSALMVALPESKSLQFAWEAHGGPEGIGQGSPPAGSGPPLLPVGGGGADVR